MRYVIGALLCLVAVSDAHATDAIWEALRAPGSVVVMRHSYAPGTFDPPTARLDDCSTQRNLDDSGRAQARRVGDEYDPSPERRHLGTAGPIPVIKCDCPSQWHNFAWVRRCPARLISHRA